MARPLPDPVLFLDECLGTGDVADALREASAQVELLLDHFASGTPDVEWLPEIGRRGWVLLTKDKWIRRRTVEKRALLGSGLAAFVLSSGDMGRRDGASLLEGVSPHAQAPARPPTSVHRGRAEERECEALDRPAASSRAEAMMEGNYVRRRLLEKVADRTKETT